MPSCGMARPLGYRAQIGKRVIIVTLMPKLRCTTCGNTRGNTLKLGKIKR